MICVRIYGIVHYVEHAIPAEQQSAAAIAA